MSDKIKLNKDQKPWAVVMYDEDGVDYVFFDTKAEADAACDAQVALGYSAEVVDCQSAARRQAIEFVRDKAIRGRMTTPADYDAHYDLWKLSGNAIYDLGEADKKYVISVASKAVAEDMANMDEHEENKVEIDEDEFNVRLHTASMVMEKCLEKSDMADLCDIAKSLEEDGYGMNLVDECEDEEGFNVHTLRINRFSAAMAKSLYHAVLDSFNEEED